MMRRSVTRHHHVVMILLVALLGAGCPSITPHANFKDALYEIVGKALDDIPPYTWPHNLKRIDETPLPNGNVEYRYRYIRTCRIILEVNAQTRLIVGARFEGKDTDCVINP